MTKSRNVNAPKTAWTADMVEVVLARFPHEKTSRLASDLGVSVFATCNKAYALKLRKTPEFLASADAGRLIKGSNVGMDGRFKAGHTPANKGVKGISHPGMIPTQFKPGRTPHNWLPIGSERLSKEGYLQRKMTDTGYPPRYWVSVHTLLWREHHGDVPDGHVIVFKDCNKKIIEIGNLECVSRTDMMRRNSLHNYPKEIVQVIHLRGAINKKINRRAKHETQDHTAHE